MLNDKYDESLVILRRRFCWSYTDIFYKKQIITGSAHKSTLTDESRAKLLTERRNLGDQLLYEKMREKWLMSPELTKNDFDGEVCESYSQVSVYLTLLSRKLCIQILRMHFVLYNSTQPFPIHKR